MNSNHSLQQMVTVVTVRAKHGPRQPCPLLKQGVRQTGGDDVGAWFRVNRIFRLNGQPGIFASGDVLEGAVAVGMNIHWPLHGQALTTYAPVATVDFLDVDRRAGLAEVALGIRFGEDKEMEELFQDLFEPGMVVQILEAESEHT